MAFSPLVPFVPALWARHPHLQTILGSVLPSPPLPREPSWQEVDVGGGDRLVVGRIRGEGAGTVYLLHGMGGSATSGYMRRAARVALDRGFGVVLVNLAGRGAGAGLAKRPFHAGATEELARILLDRPEESAGPRLAVGFSLAGGTMLLMLGRRHDLLDGAIAVCSAPDLAAAAGRLNRGVNRLYEVRFMRRLRQGLKQRVDAGVVDADRMVGLLASVEEFDECYTARAAGFADRFDYYARCSPATALSSIRTPTVYLSADDDPIVGPVELNGHSESVSWHREAHGGHMGFLSSSPTPLGSRRWLDHALDHHLLRLAGGT